MATLQELSPGEVAQEIIKAEDEPWRPNLNYRLICPDCNEDPPNLVDESSAGDTVCASCGMVLMQNVIDERSEWRSFANDEQGDDPSRVGAAANPLLDGSQLYTNIQFNGKSHLSRDLSRALNKVNDDKGNRLLQDQFKRIDDFCFVGNVNPSVALTAKHLYKSANQDRSIKSKPQDCVMASCIFIACRQHDMGRTFKEIQTMTQVPKKDLGKMFKVLSAYFKKKNALDKHKSSDVQGFKNSTSTSPQVLCTRFGSLLGLPQHVSLIAGVFTQRLIETGLLAGRSPLSVAAVGLYAISNFMKIPTSAKTIGDKSQVSDGTIKAAWKKVWPDRMKIVDPKWIERGGDPEKFPAV